MAEKTSVQFIKCSANEWNAFENKSSLNGVIVFVTEGKVSDKDIAGKIYVTDGTNTPKCYGVNSNVADIQHTDSNLVIKYVDGTSKTVTLSMDEETQKAIDAVTKLLEEYGDLTELSMYVSKLDDDIAMVNAVGGIAAGTKVSDLSKVKSFSELFDDLLFPTVQPTITAPTASLSLTGYANLQEIGAAGPKANNFNKSWSQGSIKIGTKEQAKRAGDKLRDALYYGTATSESQTELPEVVAKGVTNYYYRVYYAEGPQPLDSKGNNATSATKLIAGSVFSSAVAVTGVYPFYANTTNESFTKLKLTADAYFECTLAAEGPNKHCIKLPHNITKIEMLNTLSNQYEEYAISNFTKTSEQIDVNGNNVDYNVYTRNDAGFNGETTYKITYAK